MISKFACCFLALQLVASLLFGLLIANSLFAALAPYSLFSPSEVHAQKIRVVDQTKRYVIFSHQLGVKVPRDEFPILNLLWMVSSLGITGLAMLSLLALESKLDTVTDNRLAGQVAEISRHLMRRDMPGPKTEQ